MTAAPAFERVKDVVLLIPGIHLLICFIYLFCYYANFGSGIAYFSSPADVFSVSMQEVAPSYISLAMGVGFAYAMFLHPEKGNIYYEDTLPPSENSVKALRNIRRLIVLALGSLIFMLAAIQVAYWWRSGTPEYNLLYLLASLLSLVGSLWIGRRFALSKGRVDVLMVSALVLSSVVISGLKDGYYDRSWDYRDYKGPAPRCQTAVILRNVASLYLAVLPDNRRVLVTAECKERMQLRGSADFHPLPKKAPIEVIIRGVS